MASSHQADGVMGRRGYIFWSALATAPAETSPEAKEASIINKIFFSFSSFFYYYLLT
jgi:hypothetical protein